MLSCFAVLFDFSQQLNSAHNEVRVTKLTYGKTMIKGAVVVY